MAVKFTNSANTALTNNITNVATSFDVDSVAEFPTVGGADYMYLTILSTGALEIIKVTSVSGTTLTCVRGQDGTSGTAAVAGDLVELRMTAAVLTDAMADAALTLPLSFSTTADPTVNSDASNTDGNGIFSINSTWTNATTNAVYQCVDATATAAVWAKMAKVSSVIALAAAL